MAMSCLFIVLIPPHQAWGIYSVYCFLFARILQGISSSGEAAAADIFCTELVKAPTVYRICVLLKLASNVAGLAALILGMFCVSLAEDGWKYCFYFGGTIAVCAMNFRRKLKETKEFLDSHVAVQDDLLTKLKQKFLKKNFLCMIGLNVAAAAGFVFGYGFCSGLLKDIGLNSTEMLFNNACIVLIEILVISLFGWLTYHHYPLKLLRWRCISSFFIIPLGFLLLYFKTSHFTIFVAQLAILLPIQGLDPALPIFIKGFHPKRRFRDYGLSWALSKSITYIVTGVFATYVETQLGMVGLLLFLITTSGIFLCSLNKFVPEDKMREMIADSNLSVIKQKERKKKEDHNDDLMNSELRDWIRD